MYCITEVFQQCWITSAISSVGVEYVDKLSACIYMHMYVRSIAAGLNQQNF